MGSLRAWRQGRSYQVRINDRQAGLVLWIRDDDPPEAFTALADVDLEALRPGSLGYNREVGQWTWDPMSSD